MAKYQISVVREEADKVDTFRFAWQKLNTLAVSLVLLSKVIAWSEPDACPILTHISPGTLNANKSVDPFPALHVYGMGMGPRSLQTDSQLYIIIT